MHTLDQRLPLIADPDEKYLWTLKSDPRSRVAPPFLSLTERDTLEQIQKNASQFSAIFLNPELQGERILKMAMQMCPGTPIFYLTNKTNLKLGTETLNIRRIIQKPASYAELLRISHLHVDLFNPDHTLRVRELNSDLLHAPFKSNDSSFQPIRAGQLVTGSTSFFDLYIRLEKDQYEKIAQAGERFDTAKINEYLRQGRHHFYLRNEAQEHYLHYCDHLTSILIRKRGLTPAVKISFLLNHGNEILQYIRSRKMDVAALRYARRYVENMRVFVSNLPELDKYQLLELLFGAADFEPEAINVLTSFLLSRHLDITSERALEIVGLSALLQNVGLSGMPEGFRGNDISKLTKEQREAYYDHPLQSGRILSKMEGIDPAVIQAVEQHHERKGQAGFPLGMGIHSLNKVSEIIGISDELTDVLRIAKNISDLQQKIEFELNVTTRFSSFIVDAFNKVFVTRGAKLI